MADIICYRADGQVLDHYTQYDIGQQLVVEGVDLTSAPYFFLTNSLTCTAYVMPSNVSGKRISVNIPDVLLQDAVPLIIYISYSPDGDIGTTEYAIRIPVMPRKKPVDYVYNPESGGSGGGSGGAGSGSITIVNDLNTNDSYAALSAAQGVVLKAMIDKLNNEKVDIVDLTDAVNDAISDIVNKGEISGSPGSPGEDGRGIVDIYRTSGNSSPGSIDIYTIKYTDSTTSTFSVYNGADGEDGAVFTPNVDPSGNLSWTNNKGLANPPPVNIIGPSGNSGVSCTHSWEGTTLTVKSASGSSSADLKGQPGNPGVDGIGITNIRQTVKSTNDNGENVVSIYLSDGTIYNFGVRNGSAGSSGTAGNDGVGIVDIKQTITSTEDDGINVITVSLSNGIDFNFEIKNGSTGHVGKDGNDGKDGFSPSISVSDIDGGSEVSITDHDGTKTINIMNGKNGSDGQSGYTPVRGKDYYTDNDKQEIVDIVKSSIPEYMPVVLTNEYYGTSLPESGIEGRLFFLIEE